MRLLLFLLFCFLTYESKCQGSTKIIGKWRVVVMDNGVRYDYNTGEYTVSKALEDSLRKWKGPLFDRDDYISWAGSCSDCYFVFKQDSIYQEFRGEYLRSEGSFKLVPKDSIMKIIVKTTNNNVQKEYKYYFSKERLALSMPSFFSKESIKLELKRVE